MGAFSRELPGVLQSKKYRGSLTGNSRGVFDPRIPGGEDLPKILGIPGLLGLENSGGGGFEDPEFRGHRPEIPGGLPAGGSTRSDRPGIPGWGSSIRNSPGGLSPGDYRVFRSLEYRGSFSGNYSSYYNNYY